MVVIKRDSQSSLNELVQTLASFIPLLREEGETSSADYLEGIRQNLKKIKSAEQDESKKDLLKKIIEAFEGEEHDLNVYTLQRKASTDGWTRADEMALVSSKVLNLARRLT